MHVGLRELQSCRHRVNPSSLLYHRAALTLHKCHVHRVICWLTPVDLFMYGATPLTWWSDRVAAWSGQTRTWNQTAGWVRGHVRDGPHSSAGGLVVHSDTVRVGATHRVVGFAVMATDLFWLSAAFLRTEHTRHYLHYGKCICSFCTTHTTKSYV